MGAPCRRDAYLARLFARAMEEIGDGPEKIAMAGAAWEEFRQLAVSEAWFPANGPEAATLYLHMAGRLRKLPPELLADMQRIAGRESGKSGEELYFLYPEKLYGRACALDPHFESFSEWMDWAKGGRTGDAAKVAEAWHKIRPMDIEPILLLIEEKEKRNAFQSSLQYLAKAERLDSVHPAVRQARLRLLAGAALRQLRQKKPRLAEGNLAEIEALPQSRQGDRPAYLAALRYMAAVLRGAGDEAAVQRAAAERALGSKAAAALLIHGVADACNCATVEPLPAIGTFAKSERAGLPEALVRVVDLAKDLRTSQPVPEEWLAETAAQFARCSSSLSAAQLRTLAEIGVDARRFDLAYAVSAAGLERGGPDEASFMLMRARSLPYNEEGRWAVCAAAAAQLARHQRQLDVVDQAVELLAGSPFEDLTLTTEQAATVVRKEKAERASPTANRPGPDYRDLLGEELCDCPNCRRARGEDSGPAKDPDGEGDDFDLGAALDSRPPGIPEDIARMLLDEARRAAERGESVESMLYRLFDPGPAFGGRRKKGRRR
jgi:hypothetical protein